jgi:hypothetical protein
MEHSPFFESCRAPEGDYGELERLTLSQALEEEELAQLRQGLREDGVDSASWASRVVELERQISERAKQIAALNA